MMQSFIGLVLNVNAAEGTGGTSGGGGMMMIIWLVFIVGFFYLIMMRPQKKQRAQKAAMLSSLEVGDSVQTTSGFYGLVIDVQEDTVIVEFGSNKNCRIPMSKNAIEQVEKADAGKPAVETEKQDKENKDKAKEKDKK